MDFILYAKPCSLLAICACSEPCFFMTDILISIFCLCLCLCPLCFVDFSDPDIFTLLCLFTMFVDVSVYMLILRVFGFFTWTALTESFYHKIICKWFCILAPRAPCCGLIAWSVPLLGQFSYLLDPTLLRIPFRRAVTGVKTLYYKSLLDTVVKHLMFIRAIRILYLRNQCKNSRK